MKSYILRILNKLPYIKGIKRDLDFYESWGVPGHFYNPIPSLIEVEYYKDIIFCVPKDDNDFIGLDLNLEFQKTLLVHFCNYYKEIPFKEFKNNKAYYFFENPNYSYSDAIFLYSIIRYYKPENYIEIGSGYSSCVAIDTNNKFFNGKIKQTFIEPYPELLYDLTVKSDKKSITVLEKNVQEVEISVFKTLKENDILFIDSSHVLKTASDLQYILFKIIPQLSNGVLIHFHDIFFPFEYPREWITKLHRAWNEVYMLRAFLMYNKSFKIISFNNYLIKRMPDWFEKKMPLCLKNAGGSIWIKKIE